MREDKTILFGEPCWVTQWVGTERCEVENIGYETVGPAYPIGIEADCDGIRGVDHIIFPRGENGITHSHHSPDDVFMSREEAEANTQKEEARRLRRLERAKKSGLPGGRFMKKVAHEKGEPHYQMELPN